MSSIGRDRYDNTTIWLHWLTVILIVLLWTIGMTTDWFPRGPIRGALWSAHVVLGFAITFVLVTRISWRARFGTTPPHADTGLLHTAAETTHYALYGLLTVAVATGIANASYRGFNVFDLWTVPQFGTGDSATRRSINEWHELAAHSVMAVAGLHAAAALVHQYVWRDRLLDRMKF